jgi:3-dehydroquinate synthase
MQTFYLELNENRYPITVGSNLLNQPDLITPYLSGQQICIVTNQTVAPLYLATIKNTLSNYQCDEVILPDGENYKTLASVQLIFDKLLSKGHRRSTTLIALGGGVVGDITGFAAACYMRGVGFIQIPTTLLAQVDASIGGKTGVNHPLGKNMIGAFYQPRCVISDIDTLKTLPGREFQAGFAEVVKYGLIQDAEFFSWLEQHCEKLLKKDSQNLFRAILRSAQIKSSIVEKDERESGIRALFNLGHTFGHAIENLMGYGNLLHGEAVAIGIRIAAELSDIKKWITLDEVTRIKALLQSANLPVQLPAEISSEVLLKQMMIDKKNIHGKLRLVLLKKLGDGIVTDDVSEKEIYQSLSNSR